MATLTMPMITLVASIATPAGVGTGIIYYLNHEYTPRVDGGYLTVKEFKLSGAETNVQNLQEQIDSLQWDVDAGTATEKDKWLLEQKKEQLKAWEDKISKLRENRPTL